jgi:hypothetical protein
MTSIAHWGQLVLGWIIILVGGFVSSSSPATAAWGVIIALIGLVVATGPAFMEMRKRM